MGDVLRWSLEKHSCEVRIQQLTGLLRQWEAEEESLRCFRNMVRDTENRFSVGSQRSLQAVQELAAFTARCLTADRYRRPMEEEMQNAGICRGGAAFERLLERIGEELTQYREKQENARTEIAQASVRKEQLAGLIRDAQEE